MVAIADITVTEQWVVRTTLSERYGLDLEPGLAEAEIRLDPADRALTSCPVFYWEDGEGCHFVIVTMDQQAYRCQFFHQPYRQMDTGKAVYDDLAECAVALLVQAQADHVARQRGHLPPQTGGPGR